MKKYHTRMGMSVPVLVPCTHLFFLDKYLALNC